MQGLSQHCILPKDGECWLSWRLFHALMPAMLKAAHYSNGDSLRHRHWSCAWQCGTSLLETGDHKRWCLWGSILQAGNARHPA